MLGQKLKLLDIEDLEAFCERIIQRSRLELSFHDHEDLLAYLVETAWELSLDFQPGERSFSGYANERLRQRCFDWKRNRNGRTRWQFSDRTHERELPSFVPLDDRPDSPDAAGTVDADRVRELDLRRLLGTRGSPDARRVGQVGSASDRRAA